MLLASVQTDTNPVLRETEGVVDVGVHNLFLFSRDGRDYVGAVAGSVFGNFQVFDITNRSLSWWQTTSARTPRGAVCGSGTTQTRRTPSWSARSTLSAVGNQAYISWYSDGVLVLDISDPANPREVTRFSDDTAGFQEQNGGPQDVWGIYKAQNSSRIYASDRNGGLYVLKERGRGNP